MAQTRPTSRTSWLPLRHRAEAAASALPDLIAAAERAAASVLSGEHRQRQTGGGERFWQFRDYDPSDRPQDIDWRQSAKSDRVFVRQKEWQTTQSVLFWLQGDEGMDYRSSPALPDKRSEGVVLALTLSLLLNRQGELTALLDGGHKPGRGAPALQNLGEDLIRMRGNDLPPPVLRNIPMNAGLVLIGDFLAGVERIRDSIDAYAARAGAGLMIQVLDPSELDFPFSGRMVFEETGNRREHHILNAESIRADYRQRIADHIAALQTMCARHQWRMILHRSGGDLTATLFEAWRIIGGQALNREGRT